ncbi:MAG: GNAT family N-acetyltransferase [Smithella sp.]
MIDAKSYSEQEPLKNGLQVTIRAIRPDDKEAILAAFRELESRALYLRFFGQKKGLSPQELKQATEVDFTSTVALVICIQAGESEKIIGAGRYIVFGDSEPPDRAEVAFTVEEDYQGLGIGSITLRHLTKIARERGIAHFDADVLPENKGMLAVFNRSGLPVKQKRVDGVVHVTLSLARNL